MTNDANQATEQNKVMNRISSRRIYCLFHWLDLKSFKFLVEVCRYTDLIGSFGWNDDDHCWYCRSMAWCMVTWFVTWYVMYMIYSFVSRQKLLDFLLVIKICWAINSDRNICKKIATHIIFDSVQYLKHWLIWSL